MLSDTSDHLRRTLSRVREAGGSISVSALAQAILALDAPVDRSIARRIVAAALGRAEASLPEHFAARHVRPAEEACVTDVTLERARFAVVDLETTGLAPSRAAILEIGAVAVTGHSPAAEFQTLVRPPEPLSRAIADLTGIDDSMVAGAPLPEAALGAFRSWLLRHGIVAFVAHNARFDAGFLRRGCELAGLPALRLPVLCTQRLGRRLVPEAGRTNLDSLCAHYGISNPGRHRALGDARATARLLVELLHVAGSREGVATLGELLDLQQRPTRRARRRRRVPVPGGAKRPDGGR